MEQGWPLVQADWTIIVIFSLLVALITLAPEIYAFAKSPDEWMPVNSPPYMIGDDYHYFSLLNNVHRRFLNLLYGTNLVVPPLSANSKFQYFGYLFNLIPYHIGYLILDRRVGVLLVRLSNRFLLGLSAVAFSGLCYQLIGIKATTDLLLLTYILFLLLFPGPIGLQITSSIAFQIRNPRHIYDRANANDLTRPMFSETTGPIFIIACALLLMPLNGESFSSMSYVGLVFVVILFFHYLPAALVYSWLLFIVLLSNQLFYHAIICATLTLGLFFFFFHSVSRDEVGKELFAHSDGGRIFLINRYSVFNSVITIIFLVSVYVLIPALRETSAILILVGMGFFTLTSFFAKHQASRFWDRAAIIPFQLIAVVSSLTIILPFIPANLLFCLILFLSSALTYYYFRQAVYLYQANSTRLPKGINFVRDICPLRSHGKSTQSRIVATNSVVCAYAIGIFSGDESLLKNYSIQSFGYKKNLISICANFKILGVDYKSFENLMTVCVNYQDWQFDRPFKHGSKFAEVCYAHTLQFISTNREYNMGLVTDGMYSSEGWADQYKALLRTTWDSIDTSKFVNVCKISLEKPF
jgi:hypothetical protein